MMDKSRPDLNLLAVLAAIYETGSVSAAAEQLNLSQPAASHALNRLRAMTGDLLFVRSGQKLVATPRAAAMEMEVRNVIAAARAVMVRPAFAPQNDTAHFRIGASDYANMTMVPRLLRQVMSIAPKCTVETVPVGPSIRSQLEDGKADLSFWGVEAPLLPFHSKLLFEERLVGVAWKDHPLWSRTATGNLSIEDYLAYPHAIVAFGVTASNPVDEALKALGRARTIRFIGQSFSGNLHAMRKTGLLMTIPSRLLADADALGFSGFDLPFRLDPYAYGIIWHRRTDADPARTWLRTEIAKMFSEAMP